MIDREAKGLIKALRLQKLRAVLHLLNHIENNPDEDIAVAIEIIEDVYVLKEDSETFEQNKNYDPNSKFTINSEEILNSICSFLDIWVDNELSESLNFCFLSTNLIGKESNTNRTNRLKLNLPKEKIIEELKSNDEARIKAVGLIVKEIVFDYYKEKYTDNSDSERTINALPFISDESWYGFLKQIDWIFGYVSVEELERLVISKIQSCKYYSKYDNKEQQNQIKANLIDLVEEQTLKKQKHFRLIGLSHVELKFANAIYQRTGLAIDNVYKLWEKIDKPTDYRNLRDKILAVCPNYNSKKLAQLERTASMAKVSESSLKNSTKYLALKYRVFDFCDRELDKSIIENNNVFTEEEIEKIIDVINKGCLIEFEDLKTQYDYGISRKGVIFELFIEFIDSCYLSFDK